MRALFLSLIPSLALAQGIPVKGGASSDLANVNTAKKLEVSAFGRDGGVLEIGDRFGASIELADDGRLDISQDTPLFRDTFSGSAVAAHNRWFQSLTTMTATVGSGAITLNAGAVTTVSTYATITSVEKFRGFIDGALYWRARARPVNLPQTNATAELGLFNALTNAAPTDGLFVRWTASGGFECVINRGGVETSVAMTAPASGVYSVFSGNVTASKAYCEYETPSTGVRVETFLNLDSSAPSAFVESPGLGMRVYTAGVAPALAPQLLVGVISAGTKVVDMQRPVADVQGVTGNQAAFTPTTGAQSTNFTNSTGPVSATLSNTAAGYTTLGGKYQFAAPAGAVTDFALFGYQVPTSYRFVLTGVRISTCVTGAASATTPTMLEWGLGFGSTAVSLATADATGAAPTSAPRRLTVGEQSIPVGTAIGGCVGDIWLGDGRTALGIVESGRFLHVILSVPVGTATASETIRGTVTLTGYFEQ